jgi:hypothetical protein
MKEEQLAKFKKSLRNKKKRNTQVLNGKNVLTSILYLGAILNCHAWPHWSYFSTIKSL